jgi:hypothetical protein
MFFRYLSVQGMEDFSKIKYQLGNFYLPLQVYRIKKIREQKKEKEELG